jgi:SAM-dependent methyltransferase
VPQGRVIGIDASSAVVSQARSSFPVAKHPNLDFREGDITTRLPFDDASIDVVYTNQTLLHVPGATAVIKEAHRILKPGGLLAMRETDHIDWYPALPVLQHDHNLAQDTAGKKSGAQGYGTGRLLHIWAADAGFETGKIKVGAGGICYAGSEAEWWADVHLARLEGEVGHRWVESGIVDGEERIDQMRDGLKRWKADDGKWFCAWQGELICWK